MLVGWSRRSVLPLSEAAALNPLQRVHKVVCIYFQHSRFPGCGKSFPFNRLLCFFFFSPFVYSSCRSLCFALFILRTWKKKKMLCVVCCLVCSLLRASRLKERCTYMHSLPRLPIKHPSGRKTSRACITT